MQGTTLVQLVKTSWGDEIKEAGNLWILTFNKC